MIKQIAQTLRPIQDTNTERVRIPFRTCGTFKVVNSLFFKSPTVPVQALKN
jgi:hypothetical protein